MERKLDRAIENKERITIRLALGIADDYKAFHLQVVIMMKAVADMLQIFRE